MFGRRPAHAAGTAAVVAGTSAAAVGTDTEAVAACAGGGGVQVHPPRLSELHAVVVDEAVGPDQNLWLECLHQITACPPDAGQPPAAP